MCRYILEENDVIYFYLIFIFYLYFTTKFSSPLQSLYYINIVCEPMPYKFRKENRNFFFKSDKRVWNSFKRLYLVYLFH